MLRERLACTEFTISCSLVPAALHQPHDLAADGLGCPEDQARILDATTIGVKYNERANSHR